MTTPGWEQVITSAAAGGVQMVQFIGGEPTLHPSLPHLVRHALRQGLRVEVFSNLVKVTPALWDIFTLPGVCLATSWYTDDPAQHQQITGRNTHARTWASITECTRRGVPLRAGVIGGILAGQRDRQAVAMLAALGVPTSTDHLRDLG
jgi:molybdenum cofactor biosynthesis enzyme MoaA